MNSKGFETAQESFADARSAALEYRRRGFYPILYAHKEKGPRTPGWPDLRLSLEEIAELAAPGMNVGILLGEPSGGLKDVDLDWLEAVTIGNRWLPPTGMCFGRKSKRSSHWEYLTLSDLRRETFRDPEAPDKVKAMILELRGTGHQTMAPGSVHPSGEPVEFEAFNEPAIVELDELRAICRKIAAAALLARYWRDGQRHDSTLPLAGFLLRRGWTEEYVVDFLDAMAEAVGADRRKVEAAVHDSARRVRAGEPVTGFPTLRDYFPKRVLDKAFEWLGIAGPGNAVHGSGEEPKEWPELGELPSLTDPVPSLEPSLLPEPIRDWASDVSDRMSVPLEYVAVPAVVALASVVGRTVAIRPLARDDWTVASTAWGAIVGGPGTLKTPAISGAMRPVSRMANNASEAFRQGKPVADADIAAHQARIKSINEQLKTAAKKGLFAEFKARTEELAHLSATPPDTPVERRYLTNDATTEKLAELLIDTPRGLLVLRDELIGWLESLGKPGREGDRAFFMEAANGSGSFYVDRIARGSLYVPALTLSIFGGIQPDRLRGFFSGAMANGGEMDGLLQRFQFLVWPDDLGEFRLEDRDPDDDAARRALRVFQKLDDLIPSHAGARQIESGDLPFVRFAEDAQQMFSAWYEALMKRVRSADAQETPGFTAHLAKYPSLPPKLALLFSLVKTVDGGTPGPVDMEAAKSAIAWADFLEPHARKVYAPELKGNVSAAHALAEKIRAGAVVDGMTVREVWRREWSGLKSSGQVYEALDVLGRAAWTRIEAEETGGRDRTVIRVNPRLVKETKK